ncbi:MAG: electron transfer flavoprotein subunit beta/FixA family protein [Planctomycetota bacterium]
MKIVACVKRVPTTETQAKVAADGTSLDTTGVQYMLSFYDEIAVEKAVQVKEAAGGEVTVLSLGPVDGTKEMRECLAKGADRVVLVKDEQWHTRDARATARVLADQIRALGADLVFFGRVATDRDNAAVGPMVATMLGMACVTDVVEFELDGTNVTAKRESEAGIETYTLSTPAVITCQKGLAEPRYAGLKGIMAAKKKPLDEVECAVEANQVEVKNLALPPARSAGRIVGEGAAAVPALLDALRNEAKVL